MEILLAQPVPRNRERSFAERGIDMYHGGARFVDRQTLQVGDDTLTSRFFLIASGARPGSLGISVSCGRTPLRAAGQKGYRA